MKLISGLAVVITIIAWFFPNLSDSVKAYLLVITLLLLYIFDIRKIANHSKYYFHRIQYGKGVDKRKRFFVLDNPGDLVINMKLSVFTESDGFSFFHGHIIIVQLSINGALAVPIHDKYYPRMNKILNLEDLPSTLYAINEDGFKK